MTPKIKNIIIFVAIAVVLTLVYIFFLKPAPDQGTLVSSSGTSLPNVNNSGANSGTPSNTSVAGSDFLTLLLNVNTIKLDDSIFSDPAFNSLHDSSITLTPDNTQGRPNPFAQFGNDTSSTSPTIPTSNSSIPTTPNMTTPAPTSPIPTTPITPNTTTSTKTPSGIPPRPTIPTTQ